MGALSSGEQILLIFFSSIWLGVDTGFDFVDAVKSLDPESLQIVTKWFNDPFFHRHKTDLVVTRPVNRPGSWYASRLRY